MTLCANCASSVSSSTSRNKAINSSARAEGMYCTRLQLVYAVLYKSEKKGCVENLTDSGCLTDCSCLLYTCMKVAFNIFKKLRNYAITSQVLPYPRNKPCFDATRMFGARLKTMWKMRGSNPRPLRSPSAMQTKRATTAPISQPWLLLTTNDF